MNRLSEDQLVARMRQEIPRNDLLQAVTTGVEPPRPLVEALYRYRNEKRVADIVAFPVAASPMSPSRARTELTQFYEAHPDLFRAPEYRGFTLASLSPSDLKPDGRNPGRHAAHASTTSARTSSRQPEQREIQQILAPTEEKAKEAEAALAAGKDFADVAAADRHGPGHDRSRAAEPQGNPARTRRRRVRAAARTSRARRSRPRSASISCASSRSSRARRRASRRQSRNSRPSCSCAKPPTVSPISRTRPTTRWPAARRSRICSRNSASS